VVVSGLFDLAIVGGGPAGSSSAIHAARSGMKVLLLDRDCFPRPKVCGEFVSAESIGILGGLLGERHPLLSQCLAIPAGRLFIGGTITHTHIEPAALSIPRYELDHALWEAAAAAGVEVHASQAVLGVAGDGPFEVRTATSVYETRALINASGRWSSLFEAPRAPTGPKWIGTKGHFESDSNEHTVDLYFFKHGYCGVQPVAPGVVNVCAMVRSDVATSTEGVLEQHPALKKRSSGLRPLSEPVVTAPLIHDMPQATQGRVLQVGDAAGFIDPFLGDGISLALQTGALAVQTLRPFIDGRVILQQAADEYAARYRHSFLSAFQHAARLRRVVSLGQTFPPVVTGLLKIPYFAEWLLQMTRPRIV
jgi:menaquinone-9 beta-reductase